MRAGGLRHHLMRQAVARSPNGSGGFVEGWEDVGKLWAEITLPTGRTAPVAESISAVVTAEIRIRTKTDVLAGQRLVGKAVTYLIEAVLQDNDLSMTRLLCSNVPNP